MSPGFFDRVLGLEPIEEPEAACRLCGEPCEPDELVGAEGDCPGCAAQNTLAPIPPLDMIEPIGLSGMGVGSITRSRP